MEPNAAAEDVELMFREFRAGGTRLGHVGHVTFTKSQVLSANVVTILICEKVTWSSLAKLAM
jgi:hypothetical protein